MSLCHLSSLRFGGFFSIARHYGICLNLSAPYFLFSTERSAPYGNFIHPCWNDHKEPISYRCHYQYPAALVPSIEVFGTFMLFLILHAESQQASIFSFVTPLPLIPILTSLRKEACVSSRCRSVNWVSGRHMGSWDLNISIPKRGHLGPDNPLSVKWQKCGSRRLKTESRLHSSNLPLGRPT